ASSVERAERVATERILALRHVAEAVVEQFLLKNRLRSVVPLVLPLRQATQQVVGELGPVVLPGSRWRSRVVRLLEDLGDHTLDKVTPGLPDVLDLVAVCRLRRQVVARGLQAAD